MHKRDPLAHAPGDILAVYLIVNGSLNMSVGKIGSQCFQAAQRLLRASTAKSSDPELVALIDAWEQQGTRTITRIALTKELFERTCRDIPGVTMIDEGLTEVPEGSATVHATHPIRRDQLPRMLRHRKVPLLTTPVVIS